MNLLIGLTGKKQVGKSTAANYLRDTYGFTHRDFADPIRRTVADICGIGLQQLELIKELPNDALGGYTPRHAMQTLGTEWGRQTICPEIWLNAMRHHILSKTRLVIADVRFDNEAQLILENGGTIIEITRTTDHTDTHTSERGIARNLITTSLTNNHHRVHLFNALDEVLSCIRRAA